MSQHENNLKLLNAHFKMRFAEKSWYLILLNLTRNKIFKKCNCKTKSIINNFNFHQII